MSSLQESVDAAIRSKEISAEQTTTDIGQRGELIVTACQAAAEIERGRRESGLPESVPVPWPESTWKFLEKACRDVMHAAKRRGRC